MRKSTLTFALCCSLWLLPSSCFHRAVAADVAPVGTVSVDSKTRERVGRMGEILPDSQGKRVILTHPLGWELWDVVNGKKIADHSESEKANIRACFSSDGKILLVVVGDALQQRDPATGDTLGKDIVLPKQFGARHLVAGKATVAVADVAGETRVYNCSSGKELATLDTTSFPPADKYGITRVLISHDGTVVARAYNRSKCDRGAAAEVVHIHSLEEQQEWSRIVDIPNPASSFGSPNMIHMILSPNGQAVATYGSQGDLQVWATKTGEKLANIAVPTGNANRPRRNLLPDMVQYCGFMDDTNVVSLAPSGKMLKYDLSSKKYSLSSDSVSLSDMLNLSNGGKYLSILTKDSIELYDLSKAFR